MKKPIKVYLETADETKLKVKAEGMGFVGRGWLSSFLSKMANTPLIIVDENVKAMLEALQLQPK